MAPEKTMEELVNEAILRQEQASSSSSSSDAARSTSENADLDRILKKYTTTEPRQKYEDIIAGLDEGAKSEEEETPAAAA